MENSILYTFSTIAQALGGAFALLSAFVLFRFQSLDASMLNASIGLRSIWTFWVAVSLTFLVMTGSVAIIPYAHEIVETHCLKWIHALNLAGVVAFGLCMFSYMFVIYVALVSRYGKHIIQPRIDALIKGQ